MAGDVDMGHARALLALDRGAQVSAATQIVAKKLSVRETEALVKKLAADYSPSTATQAKGAEEKSRDMVRVEDELADPERIVAARSEIIALEAALRQLTPRQREILLAAHIDGQLNREIAARLDISLSLVEKELRHALRHCQQYVGAPADMAARGGPRRF